MTGLFSSRYKPFVVAARHNIIVDSHEPSPAEAQASTGERKIRYEEEGEEEGSFIPIPAPRRPVRQLPNP